MAFINKKRYFHFIWMNPRNIEVNILGWFNTNKVNVKKVTEANIRRRGIKVNIYSIMVN